MRKIPAYDVAPGHEIVSPFPGGFVKETYFRDDMVKITFTNNKSMIVWDDALISIVTESD
jgi:hypothetical protein